MNSVSGLKVFRLLSLIVLLFVVQLPAYSQEAEETLKLDASKLFEEDQFVEATSLYLRLLALNPRSYDYNYRYGTCLLFNSYKKQDAFKYLNYAVTDATIDVQAFYYLGKAYHLNYQFNEAIKNYELYKQKAAGKVKPAFELDRQIEMCQNGKRLLTTISDLVVLEKKETETSKFFRMYDLQNIGGDLIVAADYQSKIDKKKGHTPLIHLPANSSSVFYSSYGETDKGEKDIFVRKKLPDGSWSLPQRVAGNVNTPYDEDFPYMNPNGEYLYFCSKGHNSMGGYDIFRSKYDADNNSYGPPENMDFAISSPDNDLFFVVDSLDNTAYFASSRQSSNGNIHVYKVRVDRVPLQLSVVKGMFASSIHPENKKITITVTDFASGEKIGNFTSNEKGSYLITFPKGGKYTYEMKVEGSEVSHKTVVSIPFLREFKPLKQKIQEETLEEAEVVKVIDLFNEEVEDPMGVLAEVIKMRSELNPNVSEFNLEDLDANKKNQEILAELGFENASPQAIVAVFERLENTQEEKVRTNENLANGALTSAMDKLDEAAKKQEEAKSLVNRSTAATAIEQKYGFMSEAEDAVNEAATLKTEARTLMAFADSVTKSGTADKDLLAAIEAVTSEIKKDVQANNIADLKDVITGNSTTINSVKNGNHSNPVDNLVEEKIAIEKDKANWSKQRDSYTQTEQTLATEIKDLEASLPTAKKKDVPGIESAIASKKSELAMVVEEKENLEKKILKATKQADALDKRIQFLQDVTQVDGSKPVAPAEVQNKLGTVESKNNNTLAAYIHQQVTELKKNPAIQALPSDHTDPIVDNLQDDYEERIAQINNASNDSPTVKTKKLLAADTDLVDEIESEIEKVDQVLAENPSDPKANDRKKALTELKTATEERIDDRKNELAQLNATPTSTSPEKELADIAPNHETQLEAITESTPTKTLEAKNELDESLVAKIESEIEKVDQVLAENPSDPKAKDRKKALTELKTATEERIDDRKNELAQLNATPTSTSPEKELAAIAPNHETQLEAINESTPAKTLEAKNELDETLVAKIESEIEQVDQVLAENPSDSKAKDRKKALTELKTATEDRIDDRKNELAQLNATPTSTSPEKELAAIAPNHETQLEAITESTPAKTLEAKNELDESLVAKIESEIEKVEQVLAENPTDSKAKDRKKALTELKTATEVRIDDRKNELAQLNATPTVISPENELEALSPNHQEQLEAVQRSTPKATLESKNALDESLVDKINQALSQLESTLEENPTDQKAKDRKAALIQVKSAAQERIDERKTELAQLNTTPTVITAELELAAIAPDHQQELDAIEEETPKATLEAKNELDESLVAQIESELEDVEGQLLRNPANEEAQQRQIALVELKETVQSRIAERTTEIASLSDETAPTISTITEIAARIRPEYSENIGKIEATMEDGTKKDVALLKEETDLLTALNKAITKKEAELAKNPSDSKLTQEVADLKQAALVQEALIEEREQDLIAIEKAKIDPVEYIALIDPKYTAPAMEKRGDFTEEEIKQFQEQEQALQERLIDKLRENEKKLSKGFNPTLTAENRVIPQLMEQSGNRMTTLGEPIEENPVIAERIEAELGSNTTRLMSEKPETPEAAKSMLTDLRVYEAQLVEQIKDLKSAAYPDEEQITEKEEQLAVVRKRIGVIEVDLAEMTSVLTTTTNENDSEAQQELTSLTAQENELKARLESGNPTTQEKRSIEKELAGVRKEKEEQEIIVLQEGLTEVKTEREAIATNLSEENGTDPLVQAVVERSENLTDQGTVKPTKRALEQTVQQEEQAIALLSATNEFIPVKTQFETNGLVTATPTELEDKKRRFSIEIGQLDAEIQRLKNDPSKTSELAAAQEQKRALEAVVATIDEMIAQLENEKVVTNPIKESLKTPITYEDEVKLASSPEYPMLKSLYEELQSTQRQLTDVVKEKEAIRAQLSRETAPEIRQQLISQLERLTEDEQSLRTQLEQQENALATAVNATSQPEQLKNLLARDVIPVKQAPLASSILPSLGNGFELVTTPVENTPVKNIPVDMKLPSGLVYRVQVGAFARPIPEDLFKEFTPVTGEKLENGITRYLAGYFGNRVKVVDAQKQIRALGYADAFVVAYCDGNRITLAEARRLEDLGLCVPKDQNSLMMEIAENTLAQLPENAPERQLAVIKPSDYNKAPGAAVAEAAEERKGLYFTVQVGVYNRPVSADQVKNIDPLITKRLENGQIRYSSGIFHSIELARPKRTEAIARGISDAFITAYYGGERISLDEAKRLLAEQGTAILEPLITPNAPNALEDAKAYAIAHPSVKPAEEKNVQFISNEQYPEYPRTEISRLNNYGSFYYDPIDQRIKSVEYAATDAQLLLDKISDELDTIQTATPISLSDERNEATVVAVWESTELSGAAADWLLRLTIPHAGVRTATGFALSFEGVLVSDQEALMKTLESYGADQVQLEAEKQAE